jgi:hypothetical protein
MAGKRQFSLLSLLLIVSVIAIFCAGAGGMFRTVNPILREAGIGNRQVLYLDVLGIAPLAVIAIVALTLVVRQQRLRA